MVSAADASPQFSTVVWNCCRGSFTKVGENKEAVISGKEVWFVLVLMMSPASPPPAPELQPAAQHSAPGGNVLPLSRQIGQMYPFRVGGDDSVSTAMLVPVRLLTLILTTSNDTSNWFTSFWYSRPNTTVHSEALGELRERGWTELELNR